MTAPELAGPNPAGPNPAGPEPAGPEPAGPEPAGRPRVSVVVPTFDRAGLVGETLDSLFAQAHRPLEVVVVDDGSADDTVAVVRRWFAARPDDPAAGWSARLIEQANAGAVAARNRGLAACGGELVAFFDSDDLMHPATLAAQADAFARFPDAAYAWSDLAFFRGAPDWTRRPWNDPPGARPLADHLGGKLTQTGNGLYRRAFVGEAGGWPAGLRCGDDWAFNARVLAAAERAGRPVVYVPGTGELLRSHEQGRLLDDMRAAAGVEEQRAAVRRVHGELSDHGMLDGRRGGELRAALGRRLAVLRRAAAADGLRGQLPAIAGDAAAMGLPLRPDPLAGGLAHAPAAARRAAWRGRLVPARLVGLARRARRVPAGPRGRFVPIPPPDPPAA